MSSLPSQAHHRRELDCGVERHIESRAFLRVLTRQVALRDGIGTASQQKQKSRQGKTYDKKKEKEQKKSVDNNPQLFVLSAKTEKALKLQIQQYYHFLNEEPI